MTLKRASAKAKAEAVRLVAKGTSNRATAAQVAKRFSCDVSEMSVRRWVIAAATAQAAQEDDAPPSSHPPQPEAPAPALEADEAVSDDVYEQTKRMLGNCLSLARQAQRDGNYAAASKANRDAGDMQKILARLDKANRADRDGVFISREDLEKARKSIRERAEALAADLARTGGIVCTQCGRDLRVKIAKGEIGG